MKTNEITEQNFDQLCHEAEPELWAEFCELTHRENLPSCIWTVGDVMDWFEERIFKGIAEFLILAAYNRGTVH